MNNSEAVMWHLTPRGWEKGMSYPPADRVLTMSCRQTPSSVECREEWSCGSGESIHPLINEFGFAPDKGTATP